jgi:hypothetical protein
LGKLPRRLDSDSLRVWGTSVAVRTCEGRERTIMALWSVDGSARAESILLVGLAAAGCAAHADDTSADPRPYEDPPVLAGEYTATNGGDVASIGFYGSQYALRPAACGVDDASCIEHGTFRVDAQTLALRPDGSATETIWPFHVDSRGGAESGAVTTQSLDPLFTLIDKTSCLLSSVADSATINGATYSRGNVLDDFQKNVLGATGSPPTGSEGYLQSSTFKPLISAAQDSCGPPVEGSDTSKVRLINWHGISLTDIQSCGGTTASMSHAYYLNDGTPVAKFDGRNTTYDTQPLTVLMKATGQCT